MVGAVAWTGVGGLRIRVRGTTRSYSNEEPLYVLDGTPLPGGTGGVVFVNPYDVQNINVLKNAEDIAVYGIRGSNGVILITTKHGQPAQPRKP